MNRHERDELEEYLLDDLLDDNPLNARKRELIRKRLHNYVIDNLVVSDVTTREQIDSNQIQLYVEILGKPIQLTLQLTFQPNS
jgi:hypothetical protein